MSTNRQLYFEWLCDFVEEPFNDEIDPRNYKKLMRKLFGTSFYWMINNDGNRAEDGLYLRYRFECMTGIARDVLSEEIGDECSVLEMIIALAKRLEDDMLYNSRFGDRTGKWFWMMIGNLGLTDVTDDVYFEGDVDEILQKFMDRDYYEDGTEGALFHSFMGRFNLRTTEIWEQANLWIVENEVE